MWVLLAGFKKWVSVIIRLLKITKFEKKKTFRHIKNKVFSGSKPNGTKTLFNYKLTF